MTTKSEILGAVRAKCLDCGGGSWLEVKECGSGSCALQPFRFGVDPNPVRGAPGALAKFNARAGAGESETGDMAEAA
jgi:hypothetical protein